MRSRMRNTLRLPWGKPDPDEVIEVSISPLLTGEKRIPGVPQSIYEAPWTVPVSFTPSLGGRPHPEEPEAILAAFREAPLLELLRRHVNWNRVRSPSMSASLAVQMALQLLRVPRPLLHALLYTDAVYASWDLSSDYIAILRGENSLGDSMMRRRSSITAAEDLFSILVSIFAMDVEELRDFLGVELAPAGCDLSTALRCSGPLRRFGGDLEVALRGIEGVRPGHGDPVDWVASDLGTLLGELWFSAVAGRHPGEWVEKSLSSEVAQVASKEFVYLGELMEAYLPGGFIQDQGDAVSRFPQSLSAMECFVACFDEDDLLPVKRFLVDLGVALEKVEGLGMWLWGVFPRLDMERFMELIYLADEYNLEWAVAAFELE